MLSPNLQLAIERSMRRQRHSDFYYKLSDLTQKVYMYTESYAARVPAFERLFKERQRQKHLEEVKKWKREQLREKRQREKNAAGRAGTTYQGTARATCKPALKGVAPRARRTTVAAMSGKHRKPVTFNLGTTRGTTAGRSGAARSPLA